MLKCNEVTNTVGMCFLTSEVKMKELRISISEHWIVHGKRLPGSSSEVWKPPSGSECEEFYVQICCLLTTVRGLGFMNWFAGPRMFKDPYVDSGWGVLVYTWFSGFLLLGAGWCSLHRCF